jgi:hypothetical protein
VGWWGVNNNNKHEADLTLGDQAQRTSMKVMIYLMKIKLEDAKNGVFSLTLDSGGLLSRGIEDWALPGNVEVTIDH